jgi:hypothetical protein
MFSSVRPIHFPPVALLIAQGRQIAGAGAFGCQLPENHIVGDFAEPWRRVNRSTSDFYSRSICYTAANPTCHHHFQALRSSGFISCLTLLRYFTSREAIFCVSMEVTACTRWLTRRLKPRRSCLNVALLLRSPKSIVDIDQYSLRLRLCSEHGMLACSHQLMHA